jgi:2-oxoglutarate dehydrogenase E2 component (dihydrolipoamide succinyltransferase)
MSIEIKVPQLPESVADATIVAWHKKPGDFVQQDENLLDLETDKVVLEVPAPATGRLTQITKDVNAVVTTDEILGILEEGEGESTSSAEPASVSEQASVTTDAKASTGLGALFAGPAARREAHAQQVDLETVKGTGKAGRVTREDVQRTASSSKQAAITTAPVSTPANLVERVPMPRLRAKIAERLVMAQQQAAILTTFNEVNLKAVMDLRARYKDQFEKQHGVRLGFMSFFTKAVVKALKEFPIVNAAIEGNDIVYHHYYDIGIAVSTDRGLVVPVVRNADQLGFAEIEKTIVEYGNKARNGQISIDELTGGTFTITNGGIFGSLLSTPILNPPQSGILGMHKIEERAVVENGQVVVRPMMYIALSYDHRIIDGKESVQFLAMIKNLLEDPARLLLEV